MVGVVERNEALTMASDAGLDLVEIAPNADPPVCKILDFGKYKYEEQKKKNESMAERYNPGGTFPYTVLLDADGKVLHKWEGYSGAEAKEFISQVKACL